MTDRDHRNFLEARIDEVRAEARRQRQVAERLTGEAGHLAGAAQRMESDAYRLDREADAIFWLLRLIARAAADDGEPGDGDWDPIAREDIRAAAELVTDELCERDQRVLSALRDRARDGVAAAPIDILGQETSLAAPALRRSLDRVERAGLIATVGRGRSYRWQLTGKGFRKRPPPAVERGLG